MANSTPKSYHTDPALYLYTSLTAGSSHIITATSRLETILKANRIPFQALDVATDEKARMLWGRRAGKRKLPGLVRLGMVVGDLEEIEEWNEYGELKEKVGVPAKSSTPSAANTPTKTPPSASIPSKLPTTNNTTSAQPFSAESPSKPNSFSQTESPMAAATRQAGMEAAKKAGDAKAKALAKARVSSKNPSDTQSQLVRPESAGVKDAASSSKAVESGESKAALTASEVRGPGESVSVPRDEVYEGQGSKDPDKEAVVPDSKDTIDIDDPSGSSAQDVKPSDPEQEAVVPGSKDKIDVDDSVTRSTEKDKANDPDGEAVVPGSQDRVDAEEKELSNLDIAGKDSGGAGDREVAQARGRNSIENTTKATAASDKAQYLPGKRTQVQPSAKADEAGASVGD